MLFEYLTCCIDHCGDLHICYAL